MGMEVLSSWTCELCGLLQQVPLGEVPADWKYSIITDPVVDVDNYTVDVGLSGLKQNLTLLCKDCVETYYGVFLERPLPVESIVDSIPEDESVIGTALEAGEAGDVVSISLDASTGMSDATEESESDSTNDARLEQALDVSPVVFLPREAPPSPGERGE